MAGAEHLPGYGRAQLPAWYYLEGDVVVTPNDETLTPPSTASAITLSMETGAGYYAVNGAASANSPGYIPQDGMQTIGPIANLTSIHVHSPTGTVHYMWWREA